MTPLSRRHAIGTALVILAACCAGAPAVAAPCEHPGRLGFSIIPRGDVKKEIAQLQPLLAKLRAALGIPVEVYTPPSYGAVTEALLSGAVHLARLGPASYVSARRADPQLTAFASYANKATAFQAAGPFYHSLLVVRSGSGIMDTGSLRGKRLALVDPDSTSGALIPQRIFASQVGARLDAYFARVGYSGSHTQSLNRLLAGQVDAIFVGSQNLAADIAAHPEKLRQVRVVWRSGAIPTDPFVFRGQLCEGVKDRIRGAFLGHGVDHGGARDDAVLDKLDVLGFVPVADEDYRIIRAIQAPVP